MQIKMLFLMVSLFLTGALNLIAQEKVGVTRQELPKLFIDGKSSLHIISPEPIRYVDIATHQVIGDLPDPNLLRLKYVKDSIDNMDLHNADLGVVTIVGESFIAQYNIGFLGNKSVLHALASFDIIPEHTQPIAAIPELTTKALHKHALALLSNRKSNPIRKSNSYGMRAELGAIYTVGDLVLLDVTFYNDTKLVYDIDELRFKIEDKKITKATNVQSIELKPVWQLYPNNKFKRQFRNIYVLKKTTFPDNKILHLELSEKQISGRTLSLAIKYKDILQADTF